MIVIEDRQLKLKLEELKDLRDAGYRYIARSESGELRAYIKKPVREINFWYVQGELPHPIDPYNFDDIEWSDRKPVYILSLIKELEKYFSEQEECK